MDMILNRDLLPRNRCFGCGLENPTGLHIAVSADPAREGVLRATFVPLESMTGFPGITHGGVIYTALDCLSTWVATLLGPNRRAGWVLRSATTTYRNPAPAGQPLILEGSVKYQAGAWEPVVVRTEARRQVGRATGARERLVDHVAPCQLTRGRWPDCVGPRREVRFEGS